MNEIRVGDSGLTAGAQGTASAASAGETTGSLPFAELFAQVMQESALGMLAGVSQNGQSGGSLMNGGLAQTGMSGVLSALLASGGEISGEQGVFLLLMMMCANSETDPAMLMPLLSGLAGTDKLDLGSLRLSVGTATDGTSGQEQAEASSAASSVPSSVGAAGGGTGAIAPDNPWVEANPVVTSEPGRRSADRLSAVIGQFDVENSRRYEPYKYGSDTYCNIFVWDVTRAMDAEIPHYVDAKTGAPRSSSDGSGVRELNANGIYDWLSSAGRQYGWTETDAATAQKYANAGCPAVTAWKNTDGGSGHVQVVRPSENGGYDSVRGVAVAQAGRVNTSSSHITSTFRASRLSQVKYYVHA